MFRKFKSVANDWVSEQAKNVQGRFRALTMCKKCYTFYYKNSWHFERPEYLDEYAEEVPVRFTECPPCLELEDTLYEAESNLVLGN